MSSAWMAKWATLFACVMALTVRIGPLSYFRTYDSKSRIHDRPTGRGAQPRRDVRRRARASLPLACLAPTRVRVRRRARGRRPARNVDRAAGTCSVGTGRNDAPARCADARVIAHDLRRAGVRRHTRPAHRVLGTATVT